MSTVKKGLDQILRFLCVALFALLVVVVVWQVVSRQVLHAPATWTTSVAQYLFVWLSLFGSAWVFSEKGHIAVDFFTRLIKVNHTRGMEAAVNAVFANKIAAFDDEEERAAYVAERRREYEEDVDLERLAADLVLDHVIDPADLRDELVKRYRYAAHRDRHFARKRRDIPPV